MDEDVDMPVDGLPEEDTPPREEGRPEVLMFRPPLLLLLLLDEEEGGRPCAVAGGVKRCGALLEPEDVEPCMRDRQREREREKFSIYPPLTRRRE